ncbi:hypothetical protein KCMC57_up27490 [Kitasatospora sp. CMC57]|uniref:Secreted protein n=1 Tax=Kitasatospora sp. CMC57 TaxID=3231513 RepID=A0AB33JYL5_9ACTN
MGRTRFATLAFVSAVAMTASTGTVGAHAAQQDQPAHTRATEVCTGEFAEIQLHNNGTKDYIHYGGIQQCTPNPAQQTLTIMLFRVTGGQPALVAQRSGSKVDWTLPVWGEPFCDSSRTATYQMSAQGSADGVPSNPWPVAWSQQFTLNCWIDEPATPATALS